MIVVGERINGMFKDIRRAIRKKDKGPVQEMALRQLEAGADYLDINVGPASADKAGTMVWLVETVREVTDAPLAIDSPNLEAMRAGLEACKGSEVMINSTTGKQEDLEAYMPLAQEYDASIVGLTMDENGIPGDVNGRTEIALKILASAMEHGIPTDKLFIDPVILPVNADQRQPANVMKAIGEFKLLSDPPPHIIVGLSNISQGTKQRPLINRTYLVMCMAHGLDAAILDPLDRELMDAMITAELLLNKFIYCDSFLEAYRR